MYQRTDFTSSIPTTPCNFSPNTANQIAPPLISPNNQQVLQNEFKFFHYTPNDDNFFLVNCKMTFQEFAFLDEHSYDHKFFFQCSNNPAANYYVMCKLFSHSLIVNVLNKQICGMDIDINISKQNESLSLKQKFNLEQELKQILSYHFTKHNIPERVNTNSHNITTQSADNH